jgi:hypothetical protein
MLGLHANVSKASAYDKTKTMGENSSELHAFTLACEGPADVRGVVESARSHGSTQSSEDSGWSIRLSLNQQSRHAYADCY